MYRHSQLKTGYEFLILSHLICFTIVPLFLKAAAVDLVREIMISTGEEVEVRSYKRLTDLVIQDEAVQSLANVQPGDCIVCFSKQVSQTSSIYILLVSNLNAVEDCKFFGHRGVSKQI